MRWSSKKSKPLTPWNSILSLKIRDKRGYRHFMTMLKKDHYTLIQSFTLNPAKLNSLLIIWRTRRSSIMICRNHSLNMIINKTSQKKLQSPLFLKKENKWMWLKLKMRSKAQPTLRIITLNAKCQKKPYKTTNKKKNS
jgi:hypothetical protein